MALFERLRPDLKIRYLVVAFSGLIFALLTWKIMTLEFRYLLAVSGGILVVSLAMMAIYNIESFLVYAFVFNIPFSIYGKWMFAQHIAMPARGISIGLVELLIFISYTVWFARIFIARKESLPGLRKIDWLILLLIISQFISLIGAPDKVLGTFDIIYNIKHILIYFFIAHKVRRHHLKWIIALMLFAIVLESPLALYERVTGNVGIGSTKGSVQSADFGTQGAVPGVEDEIRAAGTTLDPHALGLYYSMILPVPFVFILMKFLRPSLKIVLSGILLLGIGGLIVTFSRSGWLSFALSSAFALGTIVFSWKQGKALVIAAALVLAMMPFYPQAYKIIDAKLFNAPRALMDVRIDSARTALGIWSDNLFFGYGPGNYLEALKDPDVMVLGHEGPMADRPVHNAFLWTAAELGLFGVVAFFGIILVAMKRCYSVLKCEDLLMRGLALAILTGLLAYLLDGVTNMMFRESTPYAQFWVYTGLAVALKRIWDEGSPANRVEARSA